MLLNINGSAASARLHTERRDAVELSLVHEHVHVDGAGVELFGAQEVEDGGEQRRVPVDEDLRWERRDTQSVPQSENRGER